jgi:hypothetical protein
MADEHTLTEITPAYRTLDEPTKLLGLSLGQIGATALAGAFAYLWLLVSPLPWRLNISLIVILGGGPLVLLVLREQGALSAPALVSAVWCWRTRPALLMEGDPERPPAGGGVILDEAPEGVEPSPIAAELPCSMPVERRSIDE